MVDDGSRDDSWNIMKQLAANNACVRPVRLSRNFGKEAALCAGVSAVRGDACILMDSDLQHPPEAIPEMIKLWLHEGFEVVDGVKISRAKESWVNRLGAFCFYSLINRMSGLDLKAASDFKLLDKRAVEAYLQMPERNTFFRGMSSWLGFRRAKYHYHVSERLHGETKWSMFTLLRLALNAITSFSALPLQVVTATGFLFFLGSLVLGAQTLYKKFFGGAVDGFTTVILLLLVTGSVIMFCLGIIGIYIAKIYDEVKARPRFIVAETIN
jgi:dolichol-phosphate mannosyltransferase